MNKKILTALLILITVESFSESRDLVCLAAPNDGFGLNSHFFILLKFVG